jgi:hypothetical protein
VTDDEIEDRLRFVSAENQRTGGWCHAGGILNFRRIGLVSDHPNYAFPHVVLPDQISCVYCGALVPDAFDNLIFCGDTCMGKRKPVLDALAASGIHSQE